MTTDNQLPAADFPGLDASEDGVEAIDGEGVPTQPGDPTDVPYHRIEPPAKPYAEYNYAQRRAVLLRRIEQAGHPQNLGQTYSELADEFDVSKSVIHGDMAVLSDYAAENLTRDHYQIMDAVFRGAVQDLADEGKMAWAAEVGKEWFEWLADMGAIERAPDKVALDARVRHESDETADAQYRVVEDDAVIDADGEVHENE